MSTTPRERAEVISRLIRLGLQYQDAERLRRISHTLRNWFEMECGTEINGMSVSIERSGGTDDGKPFRRVQWAAPGGKWIDKSGPIPDREKGARKNLAKIVARYPGLIPYVQTDCRGASVYLLRSEDVKPGESVDSVYNRGVAVY